MSWQPPVLLMSTPSSVTAFRKFYRRYSQLLRNHWLKWDFIKSLTDTISGASAESVLALPYSFFATGITFLPETSANDIFCCFKLSVHDVRVTAISKLFNLVNSSFSKYCFFYYSTINYSTVLTSDSVLVLTIAEGLNDVHNISGPFPLTGKTG